MAIKKSSNAKNVLTEIVRRINEDRRRIKLMEQKTDRIENGVSSLEESAITQLGDIKITLGRINDKIDNVSTRLNKMEGDINKLKKVMSKNATKLELKQLESFIDLVNPITSKFVTKDELDRVLDDRIDKKSYRRRV